MYVLISLRTVNQHIWSCYVLYICKVLSTFVIDLVPDAELLQLLLVAGEDVLQGLLVLHVLLAGEDLGGDRVALEMNVDLLGVENAAAPGRSVAPKICLKEKGNISVNLSSIYL